MAWFSPHRAAVLKKPDYPEYKMRTITFIRHGQSAANAGGVTQENHAIPLTALGHRQAAHIAGLLPGHPAAIIVSPFERTRATARPYCELTGVAPRVMEQLHEFETIDPDLLRGMTGEERRPLTEDYWAQSDPDRRMGTRAETFREFALRVEQFREQDLPVLPDGTVVFGHGMWIALLIWQLPGFSVLDHAAMQAFRRFQLSLPMPNAAAYHLNEAAPQHWLPVADEVLMRAIGELR
jgi:broad specificity phosphatase PhoE